MNYGMLVGFGEGSMAEELIEFEAQNGPEKLLEKLLEEYDMPDEMLTLFHPKSLAYPGAIESVENYFKSCHPAYKLFRKGPYVLQYRPEYAYFSVFKKVEITLPETT